MSVCVSEREREREGGGGYACTCLECACAKHAGSESAYTFMCTGVFCVCVIALVCGSVLALACLHRTYFNNPSVCVWFKDSHAHEQRNKP